MFMSSHQCSAKTMRLERDRRGGRQSVARAPEVIMPSCRTFPSPHDAPQSFLKGVFSETDRRDRYARRHHVALVALMFALGATRYAAVHLPSHSVAPSSCGTAR